VLAQLKAMSIRNNVLRLQLQQGVVVTILLLELRREATEGCKRDEVSWFVSARQDEAAWRC
jgi:hypothetical protein